MELLTEHGAALLFYIFAVITVVAAVVVVTQRNPMYSAIALLVSFLSIAALFLLRNAEFVSVVQVFVYGGGIMVLFLFVIMLINLHMLREVRMFGRYSPLAVVVAVLLVALFVYVAVSMPFESAEPLPAGFVNVEGEALGNSQAVAWKLYREYLLPFEIASVFLLVAMVGAVVLARKD